MSLLRNMWWSLAIACVLFVGSWLYAMPSKDIRGQWQTEGYGLVIDAGRVTIDLYQTTAAHCARDLRIPAHLSLVKWINGADIARDGDRLRVTLAGTIAPIYADPIPALPALCTQPTATDAATVFDVFWAAMNEHYALFDLHGIDWSTRRALRPDQAATDDALWSTLQTALAGLNDRNLYIARDTGGFSPASPVVWHDARFAIRDATLAQVGPLTHIDGTGLSYAILDGNIGYILFGNMALKTNLGNNATIRAVADFSIVANALSDTQGLILDNRYNPGGSDDIALAYASFFTDTSYPAFTKSTQTASGQTAPFAATVIPTALHLQQPTILLTSTFTASAAEVFTLALRARPQVTTLGDTTAGSLSDVLTFTLPNGWELGLSHQTYHTGNGTNDLGTGIPPDIHLPIDTAAGASGLDPQLARARAILAP